MRVVVIGATGTIGRSVAALLESAGHDVVRASRTSNPGVDLSDLDSVDALLSAAGVVDAVVCCAASAPLTAVTDDDLVRWRVTRRARRSGRRKARSDPSDRQHPRYRRC